MWPNRPRRGALPSDVEGLLDRMLIVDAALVWHSSERRKHERCGVLCPEAREARAREDAELDKRIEYTEQLTALARVYGFALP